MATPTNSPVLSWVAPEFFYYQKKRGWYVYFVVLGAVLIIYFLFFRGIDWTAALLVGVALLAIYRQAYRHPKNIPVEIGPDGIKVDAKTSPYTDLASFHLTNHGPYVSLEFQTKRRVGLPISVLLGSQEPDTIRTVVGRYLPEKTTDTTYINDLIGRWLRF